MENQTKTLHVSLSKNIAYQEGSVVSKEILKNASGTVTLFAFAEGQGLSEHRTPFDALVYMVDGEAEITISGKVVLARKGELIHIPANEPHALKAVRRFKMLLTMLKN